MSILFSRLSVRQTLVLSDIVETTTRTITFLRQIFGLFTRMEKRRVLWSTESLQRKGAPVTPNFSDRYVRPLAIDTLQPNFAR